MADEVKVKRPVPPQFLKKRQEMEAAKAAKMLAEQLPPPPEEILVVDLQVQEPVKKEIDIKGLIRDLALNKYFHIFEKEARPIAERMVKEGSQTLLEVKWFLTLSERQQLASELKDKYGLS